MDPAVDPFHPLIRLVDRYRREVNSLTQGASEDAIRAAERYLGHRLPVTLSGFLRRWNGASLFRGALRIRGTSELAPAEDHLPGLIAFADMPNGRRWVYAPDGLGTHVFGELVKGRVQPLHDRFDRWLKGTIRLLDEDQLHSDNELQVRRECDPGGAWLLLAQGEDALMGGDPQRALELFHKAATRDPALIPAWQRLGEMFLADGDRSQARFALIKALRASRLPAPYPGYRLIEAGALRTAESLFPRGDAGWQRELEDFLGERVGDIRTAEGVALYQGAVRQLASQTLEREGRREARSVYVQGLERARAFAYGSRMPELLLAVAELEHDLGLHDDAERHLRPLLLTAEGELRARANLVLARIVVTRQEPWAEDVLRQAQLDLRAPEDKARLLLLRGERALLAQDLDRANAHYLDADTFAVQAGSGVLQGLVCLGLGDVSRLRRQLPEARKAYDAAQRLAEQASDQGGEELSLRVLLRRGMLMQAEGMLDQARGAYVEVARGYRRLQLPVREGWALLRLVRVAPDAEAREALRLARELFMDPGCQLVAGVGAVDALSGDPGASLAWHLECGAAHARARYEAQRARPPLVRADADRPERRLGSHRIAIGAAGLEVVRALENELNRRARELEVATARSTDPSVVSYVAAVDLLASHRSYEAAQVLLSHLLERRLPELPTRALRGAITRSPNAALVDGLLEAVEKGADPHGMAGAVEVLGWRRERAAVPALRRLALTRRSWTLRRAAVTALGRIGDREAVSDLLEVLELPELAEAVAVSLLMLGDRRGVDFHGQALASGQELLNAPGEIVGRYGGPSYLLLLMGAGAGEGPKALAALQGLGYLGDARAMDRLLRALGTRDRRQVAVACGALELITGHNEDYEEPGVHARWERWWEDHASEYQEGLRYRYGQVLTPSVLAERLGDDDRLVRRGAYDELVITTGHYLPFDADGPYRVQQAHLEAWRRWTWEQRERFPAGRWLFDGSLIG